MRLLFNILAIAGSAMFAGVLLAIGVILGGYWKSLSATEFLGAFSDNGPFIQQAIPAVLLPTLVGLVGSLWVSWGQKGTRVLWLMAVASMAVLLVLTMTWFVQTNTQFTAKSLPIAQVPAKLDTWLLLHTFRIGLAALASVLGVIATNR